MKYTTTSIWIILCLALPLESFGQSGVDGKANQGTIYSPIGKRDPFKELDIEDVNRSKQNLNPLERYGVDQLSLRAIIHGQGLPKAMFEDPKGGVHIVKESEVVGRERAVVSRILNKEVIITEHTTNYLGAKSLFERVMSLPSDEPVGELELKDKKEEEKKEK